MSNTIKTPAEILKYLNDSTFYYEVIQALKRAIRYHENEAALWQSEDIIPEWVKEAKELLRNIPSTPAQKEEPKEVGEDPHQYGDWDLGGVDYSDKDIKIKNPDYMPKYHERLYTEQDKERKEELQSIIEELGEENESLKSQIATLKAEIKIHEDCETRLATENNKLKAAETFSRGDMVNAFNVYYMVPFPHQLKFTDWLNDYIKQKQ